MFCHQLLEENPFQAPRFWLQLLSIYPVSFPKRHWISLFSCLTTSCCCCCPKISQALLITGGLQHSPYGCLVAAESVSQPC